MPDGADSQVRFALLSQCTAVLILLSLILSVLRSPRPKNFENNVLTQKNIQYCPSPNTEDFVEVSVRSLLKENLVIGKLEECLGEEEATCT